MKVFLTKDKTGRIIYLTKERYKHIVQKHHIIQQYLEEIQKTLKEPIKISIKNYKENINYYHKYIKNKKPPNYLLLIVKYLNHHGYIITAYFVYNQK